MNKTKITLTAVFQKGNKYTLLLSNGDVFSCDKSMSNKKFEGNVTDRLGITIGASWRKQVRSIKSALKEEIEYYLNNPPSELIGKKVELEKVPNCVCAYIDEQLRLATEFK